MASQTFNKHVFILKVYVYLIHSYYSFLTRSAAPSIFVIPVQIQVLSNPVFISKLWFASNTPHAQTICYQIDRCEISQGGGPLDAVSMCPKTVSSLEVPQVCLTVPRKFLKVPPLFSGTYSFTATSIANCRLSQLQALVTGKCNVQILILV